MTIIHAQLCGDKTLLPRREFEQLLELARRAEPVDLKLQEDDLPVTGMMKLAEQGKAFDFWLEHGEDIYSIHDGEPV